MSTNPKHSVPRLTKKIEKERVSFELPIDKGYKETTPFIELVFSIIKRQATRIVSSQGTDFRDQLNKVLQMIWQHGYSRGLKDMDEMHAQIDKKLNDGITNN